MHSGYQDHAGIFAPSRRSNVEPFRVMEIVARASELANQGKKIILMCVGQPSAPAPTPAREAAIAALRRAEAIGYTPSTGHRTLRARIARHYRERYDRDVDPRRIVITSGSSAGFVLAFLAAFDPGQRIAIPSPGYPAYRNILRALSLEPVEIPTNTDGRWVLTAASLVEAHRKHRLDGVLVANPNNPNGTMMRPEAFSELVEAARANDIRLISDEIYHGLTYGMPETTALGLDQDAFVVNSFSKYFCMTGWRIGWLVVPEAMISVIDRLQQNAYICAAEISQIAAEAAFDGMDEMEALRRQYEANRGMFLERLPQMGFGEIQPVDGAFYAYCSAASLCEDSAALAAQLLEETGVAITPGIDFDTRRGKEWVRLSFCGDPDELSEGLVRIAEWLK